MKGNSMIYKNNIILSNYESFVPNIQFNSILVKIIEQFSPRRVSL